MSPRARVTAASSSTCGSLRSSSTCSHRHWYRSSTGPPQLEVHAVHDLVTAEFSAERGDRPEGGHDEDDPGWRSEAGGGGPGAGIARGCRVDGAPTSRLDNDAILARRARLR